MEDGSACKPGSPQALGERIHRARKDVDAAGVHPLLLAIGSERYVPYASERQPQELLQVRRQGPREAAGTPRSRAH